MRSASSEAMENSVAMNLTMRCRRTGREAGKVEWTRVQKGRRNVQKRGQRHEDKQTSSLAISITDSYMVMGSAVEDAGGAGSSRRKSGASFRASIYSATRNAGLGNGKKEVGLRAGHGRRCKEDTCSGVAWGRPLVRHGVSAYLPVCGSAGAVGSVLFQWRTSPPAPAS